jgi:hypothetical protein
MRGQKKGFRHSEESKLKMRMAKLGKKLSEEHSQKVARTLNHESGPKNHNWKGGHLHDGYVCIRVPYHPRAYANGYVKMAILVAERKLGRSLFDGEVTHHINGIKNDDRPENISVLNANDHNSITTKERWLSGEMYRYLNRQKRK